MAWHVRKHTYIHTYNTGSVNLHSPFLHTWGRIRQVNGCAHIYVHRKSNRERKSTVKRSVIPSLSTAGVFLEPSGKHFTTGVRMEGRSELMNSRQSIQRKSWWRGVFLHKTHIHSSSLLLISLEKKNLPITSQGNAKVWEAKKGFSCPPPSPHPTGLPHLPTCHPFG